MKKIITILILLLIFSSVPLASTLNPFTAEPKNKPAAPDSIFMPVFKNRFFSKIIIWQYQLKEKMTSLIQQSKATNSIQPLLFLILATFFYGIIHAAGPGHGKTIALSYILSQKPAYLSGILFGNFIALFHGLSGIIFVIFIRLILKTSIVNNLEHITNITQITSYSIIACLGIVIFIHSLLKLLKNKNANKPQVNKKLTKRYLNPVLSAFVIGSIPCPGVIMVMLFALSMDLIGLGIILGLAISLGMAFTISIVVIATIFCKSTSLAIFSKNDKLTSLIESWIEIFAGAALAVIGLIFLGANTGANF